ncbi:MAG: 2-dehydro-3-deoxyphosphooctonate aldolase [Flavobacterium sp.]|nr:2-dehydro-3-deoxyphosphooctonate aldolase [Flavobacterium sp.]
MKLLYLTFLLIVITSCTSTKSTIQNIDNSAVKPSVSNNAFEITQYATDSKYGFDADFPINIGPLNQRQEEINIGYFFNAIEGKSGEKLSYKQIDTCCPFPTNTDGIGAGTLSIYEVSFEGTDTKKLLYFNIYEKGLIACPKGFSIKKR